MMIRRDNNSNRSNHLTFSTFFIGENKSFRRISSRCLILNVVENVIDARKSGGNIRARKRRRRRIMQMMGRGRNWSNVDCNMVQSFVSILENVYRR